MIFDLVVLAALLISCAIAFLRGFIREVLTILGVVGGFLAALSFGPRLIPLIRHWLGVREGQEVPKLFDIVPYTMVADILAYGAVFIIVVIVLSLFSHYLAGWARAVGLGAVDRSLGVLFGIARAFVLLALLYLPVYMLVEQKAREDLFAGSKARLYVETASAWILAQLPDSLSHNANKQMDSAADSARATRERLQDLDVLRRDFMQKPAGRQQDDTEGYQDQTRENLNKLIGDNVND